MKPHRKEREHETRGKRDVRGRAWGTFKQSNVPIAVANEYVNGQATQVEETYVANIGSVKRNLHDEELAGMVLQRLQGWLLRRHAFKE